MKIKKSVKVFIVLIIVILIGFLSYKYFFLNTDRNENKEINTNVKDNSKYETLNKIKNTEYYNKKYENDYKKINYLEKKDFLKNISTLLDKGYTASEINNYYKYRNFDINKIDRYNDYKDKNNDLDLKDVITYVNINLDLKPYQETKEVKDSSDLLALVNKYNYLNTSYKPSDLEEVSGFYGNNVTMRKVAKDAFLKLQKDAKDNNNLTLMPTTAYRSAEFQKNLYNNYVAKDGVDAADTYSARPGFSDHQTGLAIDLKNPNLGSNIRLTDDDYKWLENNCSKYGFIIRFPKDKENITLYQFENWHIRYVGVEHAKKIMDEKLTLEEYIDLYITEY